MNSPENAQNVPLISAAEAEALIEKGPFQPSMESLETYQTPDWFRDAKFGIWSHWGPQALGEMGDRYAQHMYSQGRPIYNDHLEKYGHPSEKGYKDFAPMWKAENWNPDELMELYVKAGAKYFVSMGVHHDNFDLWDSKYQPRWNSVAMGPKRDVVGEWQKAAKKLGLPFGVSEHLGGGFSWFQTSHGADKTGPLAGVPYDGNDPEYADLYYRKSAPGDDDWLTKDFANHRDWFFRIKDLVDKYHPDLLYSDSGFPFPEDYGLPLVSHFYNSNIKANNGQMTAIYNCKSDPPEKGGWVLDIERGVEDSISPLPWQTDTSIGDWFYSKGFKYKSSETVIHLLCDIVSKNGNLLLNVVQHPDGSLDADVREILDDLAAWMPINGEAIFGTRPWLVAAESAGEAAAPVEGLSFNEDKLEYSSGDVRFTTKDGALYALILGWPTDGRVVIKALANGSPGVLTDPTKVQLLGYKGKLKWKRTNAGLEIDLPMAPPTKHAVAFKISGVKSPATLSDEAVAAWSKSLMPPPDQTVSADTNGILNLVADKTDMHGGKVKIGKDK